MADVERQTEDWQTLPWKQFQRNVYRLQQRIYRATQREDWKRVHALQRLLLHSWSARCLAVRQVTQDNRGKRTPGVDGVKVLRPTPRLRLAQELCHWRNWTAPPIRRIYIPKPNTPEERRGLGIPTIFDRAHQALVKQALEPEWEAQFEPNVYGFRPGRSTHDAIEAVFKQIQRKPKYGLDADIEKCFDRISHAALLQKLKAWSPIARLVQAWLQAGILEEGQMAYPESGTPQGGIISPLLMNVALQGLEQTIRAATPKLTSAVTIRYADDLVIVHEDLNVLSDMQQEAEAWLAQMGLRLKASKTHITHTRKPYEGRVGFDFLGFNIRQYEVGQYHTYTYRPRRGFKTLIKPSQAAIKRHLAKVHALVDQYQGAPQAALIAALNPVIRGWANYYRACVAKQVFSRLDHLTYWRLMKWAQRRHARKSQAWCYQRYWPPHYSRKDFRDDTAILAHHAETPIIRHIKIQGNKSVYDGDWVYWGMRLRRAPHVTVREGQLLKQQRGRCESCGLCFQGSEQWEIHHRDGNHRHNELANLVLLHTHCHDQLHAASCP
jgi:RNA-directed DNA polymerase